jgi:hypothetical protein
MYVCTDAKMLKKLLHRTLLYCNHQLFIEEPKLEKNLTKSCWYSKYSTFAPTPEFHPPSTDCLFETRGALRPATALRG